MMKVMINRFQAVIIVVFSILALNNCKGTDDDSWRYDPGIPPQVSGLEAESGDGVVTLSWEGNPIATSYNIYFVSAEAEDEVTTTNGFVMNVTTTSQVITGLENYVTYHFIVTALNRDGEGIESIQVSVTPRPLIIADLAGTWYFHTLVTGTGARWERGKVTVDEIGTAAVSDFQDSGHYDPEDPEATITPLPGFFLTLSGNGVIGQIGGGSWPGFHGSIASRKNMIVATFSPDATSRAVTIFQRKRDTDDYSEMDVSGTGSGQNPYYPYLQGNGPTRYVYHQLSSGSGTEWEYSNCKIGQHGQFWNEDYKDIIYWDYGTPTYKVAPKYDYLWKVTSMGVAPDGLVKEYSNYATVLDGIHNVVFTGRMSADKTLIIGVSTRDDGSGGNRRYVLRVMQLCFFPVDQALPVYTLNDLAGTYRFHGLAAATDPSVDDTASWAYGTMNITASGVTTFPVYSDSEAGDSSSDTFTLSYYPDNGIKLYTDFPNFTTPAQDGTSHYYDADGNPYYTNYDYWSYGRTDQPLAIPIRDADGNCYYYNEHASLTYNRDMVVMTRTDSHGHAMIIGVK